MAMIENEPSLELVRNQLFSNYSDYKLSVIPIIPQEKRPGEFRCGAWLGMQGWDQYTKRLPTDQEISEWELWPGAGIGLCTGSVSNIIALDFDNHPKIINEIQNILPVSLIKKRGAKGYTAFYLYNGETNHKWTVNGETVCELLSDGRQTVLPPSRHPNGINYEWLTSLTLPEDFEKLFPLEPDSIEKINKIILLHKGEKNETLKQQAPKNSCNSTGHISDILDALNFINPDESYETWIKVGMSIFSAHSTQEGFEIWDNWSKKGAKYNGGEMGKKWASFAHVTNIGIASLFHLAKARGYVYQSKKIIKLHTFVEPKKEKEEVGRMALPKELVNSAPGLVGKIARWINETSIYPQPQLALAASLAAVGALKAHRVRTQTNLRTNLYTIGVAPTGAGKGHAISRIEALFEASGLVNIFGGEPVSDTAILQLLIQKKGRSLIQWDELGIALNEMTKSSAPTHKSAILSMLMRLFSSSAQTFRGKQYTNHDQTRDRQDIDQPCLSLYGASTPSRFYGALSSEYAIDGFCPRFLIFETSDPYPKRRDDVDMSINPEIIAMCQKIDEMPRNATALGNIDALKRIDPRVVLPSNEGKKILFDALDQFDELRKKWDQKFSGLGGIWGRAGEHVQKISLTIEDSFQLTETSISWAVEVVKNLTTNLCDAVVNHIADNSYQKSLNKVLEIIKREGEQGISTTNLSLKTRWLKTSERRDILENLTESELVKAESVKSVGAGREKIILTAL